MIMTIDEAVTHAKEVAEKNYLQGMLCHANPNDSELDRCIECGREHEQLAEWLQELKLYREIGTLEEVKDALARKIDNTHIYEWIPCSERLPEDARNVLVTFKGSKTTTEAFYGEQFDKWFMLSDGKRIEVIAWMDKPEPYREDE